MKELIAIENDIAVLDPVVSQQIADFERQAKVIKEKEDKLKQAILNEMENKNIIKIETDNLLINYIAPSERETLDSKKFKEELPQVFNEYVKFTPVKSSIRLKVK